jgi:hypothetical protein
MSDYICLLVTVLYDRGLERVAIKVHSDDLSDDAEAYLLEHDSKDEIHDLLPMHIQSMGPVVHVERIAEVCDGSAAGRGEDQE